MASRVSHKSLRGRTMTLEECAARMERLLNKPPRAKKTRQYVATLPRAGKRKVSLAEYEAPKISQRVAKLAAVSVLARLVRYQREDVPNRLPSRSRSRLRPKARTRLDVPRKWACRPSGIRHRDGATLGVRKARDMEETRQQRLALYRVQSGLCGLCGHPLNPDPARNSLDHVIPLFDGGKDGLGNLLLCHGECNGQKSNDVPTGCELVMLLAANSKLAVEPTTW